MGVEGGIMGAQASAAEARFTQLYARFYRPIRAYCNRRVPSEAGDDAVAEVFLTMWRRLDDVPEDDAALVWLYGVAYRVIGHQWRSVTRRSRLRSRLQTAESTSVAGAGDSGLDEVDSRVLAALARLNETDAEVLRLDAWEQLSAATIAAVLDLEPDAARQRLHRARRRLAREYDSLLSRATSGSVAPLGGAQ
jgi:RNA polymerase sigma-70 factor (ECF subfamily)